MGREGRRGALRPPPPHMGRILPSGGDLPGSRPEPHMVSGQIHLTFLTALLQTCGWPPLAVVAPRPARGTGPGG